MMTPNNIQSRAHIAATIMGHKSEEYVIYDQKTSQMVHTQDLGNTQTLTAFTKGQTANLHLTKVYAYTYADYADAGNAAILHLNVGDKVYLKAHDDYDQTFFGQGDQISLLSLGNFCIRIMSAITILSTPPPPSN
uniref:C1q domain-containing protein n=1 Tax=Magallana gigas TaxID=29159 RepID=K1QV84_MAGGI